MDQTNRKITGVLLGGAVFVSCLFLVIIINVQAGKEAAGKKLREEFLYFQSFSLDTANGGHFTSADLGKARISMINGWAPWCSACVNEMPDLEELSKELAPEGVQIIGVVADYADKAETGTDYHEQVLQVIRQTGAAYPILLADRRFCEEAEPMMNGFYPGTWFVDENGQLLKFVTGSLSKDEWKKLIMELLEESGSN